MLLRNALAAVSLVLAGLAEYASAQEGFRVVQDPSLLQWKDNTSVLQGTQRAVVDGDPTKAGPFVLRFRCPDKYQIEPHFHPESEAVTVLEGVLHVGIGQTFDYNALTVVRAGGFINLPKDVPHFGLCDGNTVLEIHAVGPWGTKVPDGR